MLTDWTAALAAELGIDDPVDVPALLDLARDAAHHVERPAAPVTTFLVGLAAGRAGGTAQDVAAASAIATRLATSWAGTDGS